MTTGEGYHIFQLSISYWQSCVLHAALRLDLFRKLGSSAMKVEEVAHILKADVRGISLLLNALAALDFVKKEGELFSLTIKSQKYLDDLSPQTMIHIVKHTVDLYQNWGQLSQAVLTGKPVVDRDDRESEQVENFLWGMHDLARSAAPILAEILDLSSFRYLLDLGGGPATYAIEFCRKNPKLEATIFDLPDTEPIAQENIRRNDLGHRIQFVGGDFLKEIIPERYDCVFVSQIVHGYGPDVNLSLLKKVYEVMYAGGQIVIQDFILDESKTRPKFAAIFALNMLLHTEGGRSYTAKEIENWLTEAGFKDVEKIKVDLPNEAGLIRAIK